MTILLFPGRHLLHTAFQEQYLRRVLQIPISQLDFLNGERPAIDEPIDQVLFAVTSSNQQYSRYNPFPFHVRAIGVDRFARSFEMAFGIRYRIIGIPHYPPTPRFASIVLKEIEAQTEGNLRLTPENCVVLCSTPAVIEMYQGLGFSILPAELGQPTAPGTPTELLQQVAAAGENWAASKEVRSELAASSFDLWQDFPDVPRRIFRLWRDPLLNDKGGLTDDRDYSSYAYGMSNNEIVEVKFRDIKDAILPGKIVDEGCADGALLARVSRDFPDSDLIGIEITGEFMARCKERQRAGDFGGSFVHFHQRNITRPIFEPDTINSTLCNSTIHELWSYGQQEATVREYLAAKYAQTAPGGRLIIRDVIGPEAKDQEVYLWLDDSDGSNEVSYEEFADRSALAGHLAALSTYSRFKRFAVDFLAEMRASGVRGPQTRISYREEQIDGQRYLVMSAAAAAEFLSKKDYTDNWRSEMNEEFAFWNFSEWKQVLSDAGFAIIEDPNEPQRGSRVYTSRWIVDNRYEGRAKLFSLDKRGKLRPLQFPPTNVVLVAEKRMPVDQAALI